MYIDPAFGGMLLQVILGIVAVGGAIVYSVKRRAKRLLGKDNTDEQMNTVRFSSGGTNEMVDTLAEESSTMAMPAEERQPVIDGDKPCFGSPSPASVSSGEPQEVV